MRLPLILLFITLAALVSSNAQQAADTSFLPQIDDPAYEFGTGPVVMIDEAHYNFHTMDGRYFPFAELLRRDGYQVKPFTTGFSKKTLEGCDILVIANALNRANVNDWSLPTPAAFTMLEAGFVQKWVKAGGSLLFIADHMPFPRAALEMAKAFRLMFNNGFAMDTLKQGATVFRRSDSTLREHVVTSGRNESERIDSVATFTGQAFRCKVEGFVPLLVFDSGYVSLMPRKAWEFDESTEIVDVEGWYQGGVMELREGRVAVFGEAAMFTAQTAGEGGEKFGMNAPVAGQNVQFLRNIMRWLSRKI